MCKKCEMWKVWNTAVVAPESKALHFSDFDQKIEFLKKKIPIEFLYKKKMPIEFLYKKDAHWIF